MKTIRFYNCADGDMLTVMSGILDHALENKAQILDKRPGWADPYLPNIQTRIDEAFLNIIGVNNVKLMKVATLELIGLRNSAILAVRDLKDAIEVDFKRNQDRRNILYALLGFEEHYNNAQLRHIDLVKLLQSIKLQMTPDIQTELEANGLKPTLIPEIIAFTDSLTTAEAKQESLKTGTPVLTQNDINELNAIYDQVMGVAKTAKSAFRSNPAVKQSFTFIYALRRLRANPEPEPEPQPEPEPTVP